MPQIILSCGNIAGATITFIALVQERAAGNEAGGRGNRLTDTSIKVSECSGAGL